VSVSSNDSQSDDDRSFHSLGKQPVPTHKNLQIPTSSRAQVVATETFCNWNTQLLEVLRLGLMETLKDDRAELVDCSL